MANEQPEPGFDRLRQPKDEWAAGLWLKHGLGGAASLATIEPIFKSLWPVIEQRQEAVEIALGRRVDADELRPGAGLEAIGAMIVILGNPELAFGVLLLAKELNVEPDGSTDAGS